jgi:hypothetical protein
MLANLPESYLYDDLPQFIVDLDVRKLIQAVVGGYQDRIADLRSLVGWFENLNQPAPAPLTCVFATYVGDAGNLITRTLDVLPDTPVDDPVALLAWAAAQMDVDPSQVTAVTVGTDLLRQVGVDTVQFLARSLGATLYSGPATDTAAEAAARQQRAMATYFPRLKTKGTAQSFATVAKLSGFGDAAMTPLWGRLSPREALDIGSPANDRDFAAVPDYFPTPTLPDPEGNYDPQDFTDGAFYQYASPALVADGTSDSFYLTAVNGANPFFRLVQTAGSVVNPVPGSYPLAGGAPALVASVALDSGTVVSGLLAQALVPGDSFNGLPIVVAGSGTWRTLSCFGALSSIKYRTSYFDLGVFSLDPGTIAAIPNTDLEANPDLVTPAGTAPAPWRPWANGWQPEPAVTLWPEKVVLAGTVAPVPVTQAAAGTPQVDAVTLQSDATRTFGYLEDVRAATRLPRRKTSGLLGRDAAAYAPYPAYDFLTGGGSGTFFGTLLFPQAPFGDYAAEFSVVLGDSSTPLSTEQIGSVYYFGGSVTGDVVSGWYDFSAGEFGIAAGPAFAGTVVAEWVVADSGTIRPEPPAGMSVSYEARPEAVVDVTGTFAYVGVDLNGSVNCVDWDYETQDEYPWRRLLRAGGEVVSPDYFMPFGADPMPTLIGPEARVVDDAGVAYGLRVLDLNYSVKPYRVRAVALDEPEASAPVRLGLGVLGGGGLAEVRLVSEELLIAAQCWVPARYDDLTAWWPMAEHPDSALVVEDVTAYPDPVAPQLMPSHRVWDPFRGWGLSLPVGVDLTSTASRAIGDDGFTAGLYVQQGQLQPIAETFALLGPVSLYVGSSGFSAMAVQSNGTAVSTGWVPFAGAQAYVFVSLSTSLLTLGAADPALSPVTVSAAGIFDPTTPSQAIIYGTEGLSYLQDFSLWASIKLGSDLAVVRNPAFTPLETVEGLPYVSSVRGDRYGLAILDSGFVVPAAGTNAATRPTTEALDQGYVGRYDATGQFDGDDEFKLVGLGGAQVVPPLFPLGLQGPEIEGAGKVVLAGTTGVLPGETYAYAGTLVGQAWAGTVAALPNFNAAQDRAYILAGDGTTVYEVGLDNTGSGPEFTVSLPLRSRPAAEEAIVGPDLMGYDEPTDAVSLLAVSGNRLSVAGMGTTGVVYVAPWAGTVATPPLFIYNQSQVWSDQPNAFSVWLNANSFGTALGVAALPYNGDLSFEVPDALVAGYYRITVDAGNIGVVDDDFAGFEVSIQLQGSSGAATVFTATLLPDGAGLNPRGLTSVDFTLASNLSGPWVLTFTWANEASVPSRGQVRQLAVYGYEIRKLAPVLYQVTLSPPDFVLTPVSTSAASPVSLPAGAWVGALNSYGTIVSLSHESTIYSATLGQDAYDNSRWPVSNTTTGSTARRTDDLAVLNPVALPDVPAPEVPVLSDFAISVSPPYYVGETVELSVNGTGTNLGYVWVVPGTGTVSTRLPQASVTFAQGGDTIATVTAVDDMGQWASVSEAISVVAPPSLQLIVASVNNQPLPYTTNLTAFAADPGGLPLTYLWMSGSTVIGTTEEIAGYQVSEPQTVSVTVANSAGLTTTGTIPLFGAPNQPPTISLCEYPATARAGVNLTQDLVFSAIVSDPDERGIASVVFSFWDATTAAAILTPIGGYGNTYYATLTKVVGLIPAGGQGLFSATVTDEMGYSATANGIVELVMNTAPVIQWAYPVNPGVAVGQLASFAAYAIDAQGDTVNYRWDFTSIGETLWGGNVDVDTSGTVAPVGASIDGLVTVYDQFGASMQVSVAPCIVYATGLKQIGLSVSSGIYSQGVAVVISSPDANVTIRYTLDGTDPQSIDSGLPYGGAVNVPYNPGYSVTLNARAFLSGVAPSPRATATYTFQ